MSKYTIVDRPDQLPACCRLCGTSEDRSWFLDLQYMEDFHGHVYICNVCFREVAYVCDYQPLAKFERQTQELKSEHNKLKADYDRLIGLFNSLSDLGIDLYVLADYLSAKDSVEQLKGSSLGIGKRKTDTDQQDSEQRSISLSDAGSNVLKLGFAGKSS